MAGTHLGIYLTYGKNKTFELPVNPSELKIKYETDDKQSTVIGLGEINQLGEYKLRSFDLESTLPRHMKTTHYLTAKKLKARAQDYLSLLIKIYKSRKPIRFVVSSTAISIKVTISAFDFGFTNGYDGEYWYTISFTEYRSWAAKKVKPKKKKVSKKGASRSKPAKKIGKGSKVIVNASLHSVASGGVIGSTGRNITAKVKLIMRGAKYPYYIQQINGNLSGWVAKNGVRSA